ncbi:MULTISPECIES: DUF2231 domain-containing protein [Nostoc]|jgi:uncharacterized membrane protein|uniref:DUF2231 domain-containing protein n=2 Tax=Nostoc TaxID=1177 RepID=A0ABR8IDZ0_9NOSO|nr:MULTISPECIES: DUF2231 domain-containing protein [Nostoc]MBD0303737.1 DUF2231 domain-containing protein [Tolypothrix sp. T3-bin4]MBW4454537.1 DUF2231 domain-containing protein [Nostoc indistinguendum CM1-VF10]MBD2242774.1 DUF2231 domain-containing protein [Nostoc sp. FACHB-888]MBD2560258.1 DUF2231 domain-containing protein [Nostoc linckia FACHB-391]MBD2648760.1 DUF2231 domain-containing protein [Nostoc foliaceum FACHB-393]
MNSELIDQLSGSLGANGLPYTIPIHPNLVHLTIGLFIIGMTFDIVGVLFPFEKWVFKFLAITVERDNLFDVGWYNMLGASIITFFTVAAGFYEMLLATPPADMKSAWGLQAMETMLWHGVGGVFLLALIVVLTIWRGWQRFVWAKQEYKQTDREVQWIYLLAGIAIMFILYVHGTLGAQMAAEFGVHNTADNLLRSHQDLNTTLK